MKLIEKIEGEQIKKHVPFHVGDSVKVHTRVKEGDKERVQVFAGIIIAHKGRGLNESFTVRRISYGEGVERVFPVNSPNIEAIEVELDSEPMKARLYYLRNRTGKAAVAVNVKTKRAEAAPAAT
jgi:large subunit ribosomal protein L19